MQEARLEREDLAVVARTDADVVDLLALVRGADEVLAPVLGPLDRHPEQAGRQRHHHLLGIELDDLDAEAAADVGRDDVDAVDVEVEQAARGRRGCRSAPASSRAPAAPPSSSNRATTPRPSSGVAALRSISQPPLEDVRRGGEAGVDVAVLLGDLRDDVVGPVAVHERRVRGVGVLDVGHDRERLVLDDDRARRVLGDVAVARDDHRDRLADVADLVARQRVLRAPVGDRLVRDDQRQRLRELPVEVLVRVDRVDAVDVERAGRRRCRRSARARSRSARTPRARRRTRSRPCTAPCRRAAACPPAAPPARRTVASSLSHPSRT